MWLFFTMIHSTGTVRLLGDGEVSKLQNGHGINMTKTEEGHTQNQCQL